jgi:hypothetical protein
VCGRGVVIKYLIKCCWVHIEADDTPTPQPQQLDVLDSTKICQSGLCDIVTMNINNDSTWQIYSFQFVLFSSSSSSPTQLSLFSCAYIPLFRLFTALL